MNSSPELKVMRYKSGTPFCLCGQALAIRIATLIRNNQYTPDELIAVTEEVKDKIMARQYSAQERERALEYPYIINYVCQHAKRHLLETVVSPDNEVLSQYNYRTNLDHLTGKEEVIDGLLKRMGITP